MEIDHSYCRSLREEMGSERWLFIRADLLEHPMAPLGDPYPLVGNLPYHITGPALKKILDLSPGLTSFQGLVQWDVGERLAAQPGDSEYRGISLLVQWAGSVDIPFRIPASAFNPVPDVDSAWIEFEPHRRPYDRSGFASFVRRCFQHPRKTLVNNLAGRKKRKDRLREWMKGRGWNVKRRPQSLTPEEMEVLFEAWSSGE